MLDKTSTYFKFNKKKINYILYYLNVNVTCVSLLIFYFIQSIT